MSAPRKRSLAVLVADDSADICALVAVWIESFGHRVTCAATGKEAIAALARAHFDLIVTDVHMPEGDGLEVLMAVKKQHPSTRVLMMSGGGTVLHSTQALAMAAKLGAHAMLAKPFTLEEFLDALRQAVPASGTSAPFP